jgi:hypothetical protein
MAIMNLHAQELGRKLTEALGLPKHVAHWVGKALKTEVVSEAKDA